MNSEYETKMAQAQQCEDRITQFNIEDSADRIIKRNFLVKAQHDAFEVTKHYQTAFDIYRQYDQPEKAKILLEKLFEHVETCDEFASSFAMHLLLTTKNYVSWLDQISPGARAKIRQYLRKAFGAKLSEFEMTFWLLAFIADRKHGDHRSVLEFLRDLVDTEEERKGIDFALQKTMELAAHFCVTRGTNLDTAEMWYRHAALIAQTRTGESISASQNLEKASRIKSIASHRLFSNEAFATAIKADPSSPEYAEAMRQLDIAGNLTVMLHRQLAAQPIQRFLATPNEFIAEYEAIEDKLGKLLKDERLLFNKAAIETRIAQSRGESLGWLEWVGYGEFIDIHGNPRDELNNVTQFIYQFISEVEEVVTSLFLTWQDKGDLTSNSILEILTKVLPDYDWGVFENGLSSYFQRNYIAAVHALIPQFENVLRVWARMNGAETKKFDRQNIASEKLLHDFISPNNTEMQTLLGIELFNIIAWYMVNDGPFDYRNKLAHGWLSSQECSSPKISAMTIWLTLKVATRGVPSV